MLRKEKIVPIDDQEVKVFEVSVSQIGEILGLVDKLSGLEKKPETEAVKFIQENWPEVVKVLSGATSLGEEVAEAGGSAMIKIFKAFVEVNADFFGGLKELKPAAALMAAARGKPALPS